MQSNMNEEEKHRRTNECKTIFMILRCLKKNIYKTDVKAF